MTSLFEAAHVFRKDAIQPAKLGDAQRKTKAPSVPLEKLAQSVEQLPFKEWVPGSIPGLLKRAKGTRQRPFTHSPRRISPLRLAVRTRDFHSRNRGSIPLGDATTPIGEPDGFFYTPLKNTFSERC